MNQANKLAQIIEKLSLEELKKIEKDLSDGNFQKIIEKKIESLTQKETICAVCNNKISEAGFVLFFGPDDFRKKANFCAFDCLEYFINHLKKSETEGKNEEAEYY